MAGLRREPVERHIDAAGRTRGPGTGRIKICTAPADVFLIEEEGTIDADDPMSVVWSDRRQPLSPSAGSQLRTRDRLHEMRKLLGTTRGP